MNPFLRNKSSSSWALMGGHVIECFDNTLYGFFAVILAPLFFPSTSYAVQILGSYGAFAAGFLARPVGAIIFGGVGDKTGRRKPLLYTMGFVGIPTIGIGLLPSYETIGIMAPILLILCRLLQGLFMGGEFAGVNIYLLEGQQKKSLGTNTGYLISSGIFGAILATGFGAMITMDFIPDWGWRVPFLLGGLSAFCVYLFRKKVSETQDFIKENVSQSMLASPWKEVLLKHKFVLGVSCLATGLTIMPLYLATIFGNRLFKEIGFSQSESMFLNMFAMFLDAVFVTVCGKMADRVGFKKQTILGAIVIMVIALPSFVLVLPSNISTLNIYFYIFILASFGCVINGSTFPYVGRLFPIRCRYTGLALSITVGHALLGGTTPLIASFLTDFMGTRLAPAFWLMFIAGLTAIGIFYTNPLIQENDKD
ncbi:MAG: MFS transporter [Alphaproteobacteria bacterium]|jgi:MFS transporter, MHS family, proline/betaine transporter|nr:MFS transporter [Alphaproteobacteria bacterium]